MLAARYKTILVLILTAVAVCLGVLNWVDRANWQPISDGVVWVETRRGLEVGQVSEALRQQGAVPQPGDLLLSLNQVPIGGLDDLVEVRDFLVQSLPAGTPASYLFQTSGGETIEHRLLISRQSAVHAEDVFLGITALGFLLIGLFIFLRHWKAAGAFHFYLFCLISFIALLFRHSGRADTFDLVVYWFNAFAFLFLPALFLHFCLVFPERKRSPAVRVASVVLYVPAALLALIHVTWFLGWLRPWGLPRTEVVHELFNQVELTHFLLGLTGGGVILFWKYRRTSEPLSTQQLKWITYSSLLGVLPFVVAYGFPYLQGATPDTLMQASVMALLLVPLGFGYAITRYRLMDVDLIFKRGLAYLLASSALVGLYVAIVVFVGRAVENLAPNSGLLLFTLSALLVAFLFAPIKNWIQERIDRHFYRDRYDYRQSFADFGRTLSSEFNLPQLIDKVTRRISDTLDIEPIAFYLRGELQSQRFFRYPGDGENQELVPITDAVLQDFERDPDLAYRTGRPPEAEAFCNQLLQDGFRYIQPLEVHDRLIGFLALGTRLGGLLSSADLELIGTLSGYAAIAIDNARLYQSLEKNAAQLSELKAYNENVIESITVGVVVVSADGDITTWNSWMESFYALPAEDAVGRKVEEIFPQDLVQTLRQFVQGPGWNVPHRGRLHKTRIQCQDGKSRMVNIALAPLVSSEDLRTGTLLLVDDITDKTRLENQLLQAEKLSSIGLFAAGVAHEVNTPLAGISSYAQMLLKELDPKDARRELLEKIEQQSFRASEIVNNLLNFARVSENDFAEVNLNSVMMETLSLLEHPLRRGNVDVELDLDPTLPPTVGSGGKLQQVFMNLFLNARDAMPGGGSMTVRTFSRDRSLVVQVEDEGAGIEDDHLKRIYDPFFTTKDVGKGTGLGLSVSYGIIQEHSGHISAESLPGKGTVFTIELPLKRVQ